MDAKALKQATENTMDTMFSNWMPILSYCMKWDMQVGKPTKTSQKTAFSIWMKEAMTPQSIAPRKLLTRYSHHDSHFPDSTITTCANGCCEEKKHEIHGACGPLLICIHSTTKTKERDKAEQTRQRMG
jgi:hypothetical protein